MRVFGSFKVFDEDGDVVVQDVLGFYHSSPTSEKLTGVSTEQIIKKLYNPCYVSAGSILSAVCLRKTDQKYYQVQIIQVEDGILIQWFDNTLQYCDEQFIAGKSIANKNEAEILSETEFIPVKSFAGNVYKNDEAGDCTNGGISKGRNTLYLVPSANECLTFQKDNGAVMFGSCYESDIRNVVSLERKGPYTYVKPVLNAESWYMNGGNFFYSCDSRWRELTGESRPLPIHDRREF